MDPIKGARIVIIGHGSHRAVCQELLPRGVIFIDNSSVNPIEDVTYSFKAPILTTTECHVSPLKEKTHTPNHLRKSRKLFQ